MIVHVVHAYPPRYFKAWLDVVLGKVPHDAHASQDLFLDNAIYVMSDGDPFPFHGPPAAFLEGIQRTKGKMLLHLSDERWDCDYSFYRHFDGIIRTHLIPEFRWPAAYLTVPVGYPSTEPPVKGTKPASARQYRWSFAGNAMAERRAMVRAFADIQPSVVHLYDIRRGNRSALSADAYGELLRESAFAPAPMGNTMIEVMRLYEALEAGCIPIVPRRLTLDYYRELFGKHPIPTFRSWSDAAVFVRGITPPAADALQADIGQWWAQYQEALQKRVAEHVERSMNPVKVFAGTSGAQRLSTLRRLTGLLRHATIGSTVERIGIVGERLSQGRRAWH